MLIRVLRLQPADLQPAGKGYACSSGSCKGPAAVGSAGPLLVQEISSKLRLKSLGMRLVAAAAPAQRQDLMDEHRNDHAALIRQELAGGLVEFGAFGGRVVAPACVSRSS